MRIIEVIAKLEVIRGRYGEDTQIYFDCPDCKRAFTPDFAAVEVEKRVIVSAAEGKRE